MTTVNTRNNNPFADAVNTNNKPFAGPLCLPYLNLLPWVLNQSDPVIGDHHKLFRILAAGRYGVSLPRQRCFRFVLRAIQQFIYDNFHNNAHTRGLNRLFRFREMFYFKCFATIYKINLLVFRSPILGQPPTSTEFYFHEHWNGNDNGTQEDVELKAIQCILDDCAPLFGIFKDEHMDFRLIKLENYEEEVNGSQARYRKSDGNVQPKVRAGLRLRIVDLIRRDEIVPVSMFDE